MALFSGRRGAEQSLREELQQAEWQIGHLEESFRTLEDQMVDDGWRRMVTNLDRQFTRQGLDDLTRMSRAMYLAHPLIQRAVNVRAYYTWAQGVHIQAEDERVQELVIDPMLNDPGNKTEIFGHQARILTDVDQSCDGNNFASLWTSDSGEVSVRSVPPEEIREIHSNPDDRREVWFYRRCWIEERFSLDSGRVMQVSREVLYPDFRFALNATRKPGSIGGIEVQWDAPIIHLRTGGLKQMLFGIPETYAALDWARAYQKFLSDWHTIVASLARFAWQKTVKGRNIQDAKTKLGSTITPDAPVEGNRPPVAGSVHISTEGDEMTPIPKSGATTSAEDARPSRLMVAAAMDLPDTILSGDADQGNLATAKTLDRPTELAIVSRRAMWADFDQDIYSYAIAMAQLRGRLGKVDDPTVNVTFPSVIEHDMENVVKAIVTAATLNGQVDAGTIPHEQLSRMLLQALQVENVEQLLDELDTEHVQQTVDQLPPEQREALLEAVKRLADLVPA